MDGFFLESFEHVLDYVFTTKKITYFKVETTFKNVPDTTACTKLLDHFVEQRNLMQLRMMTGAYLVQEGIFSEELIIKLDNQSKVSNLGIDASEEEKVFEQCVYWRNEFMRWLLRDYCVANEWEAI